MSYIVVHSHRAASRTQRPDTALAELTLADRSRQVVIGICGPLGSGVSTTAAAVEKHGGFHRVSLSAPIKSMYARKINKPALFDTADIDAKTRVELQNLGNEMRKSRGDYWVEEALKSVPTNKPLIVDGIRNLQEVNALRQRFASFYLVSLYADADVRWERLREQFTKDQGAFEKADTRDSKENLPYGQQVSECVAVSDYVLVNNSQNGARDNQLLHIYNQMRGDIDLMQSVDTPSMPVGARAPSPVEANMATAYAQSHISQCMKRHVGAVIVSQDGFPLSMGFNENPLRMRPCRTEFGYCFKDADMDKKLETKKDFHCPKCGKLVKQLSGPEYLCTECNSPLKPEFFPNRNMELCTAIHAEERAIRSLGDRSAAGGCLYTTTFPCFQCARYIVDAEISQVVYVEAYPVRESRQFLIKNGVAVLPFSGFKARAFNIIFRQVA